MFRDGCEVPPRHHHAIPADAQGRQRRHAAADAGLAGRRLARGQDRHRVSRQCQALAAGGARHLYPARRRDRRARGGARRHRADPAPHRRRLGPGGVLSRTARQRRAPDGRHRRAGAASDCRARRDAPDPARPWYGAATRKRRRRWRRGWPRTGSPPRRSPIWRRLPASPTSSTCATLAREPLIRGAWLKPGAHLDLVGGYTPEMREADDDAVARARVYIDTDAALQEAGDIVQPLRSGALARERIAGDLFALCRGEQPGRRDARPRSRCSNRSAPRSKTLPPPGWRSAGSKIEYGGN